MMYYTFRAETKIPTCTFTIMNTNLYTKTTPLTAVRTIAQIRVLTARGWQLQPGNILLLIFEWLFYLLAVVWIAAAIALNEAMLIALLQDMQDTTLQIKGGAVEMGMVIYMAVKIMMAVLGLFSLAVGLLLRKWHRKNKVLAKVHALTETFVAKA